MARGISSNHFRKNLQKSHNETQQSRPHLIRQCNVLHLTRAQQFLSRSRAVWTWSSRLHFLSSLMKDVLSSWVDWIMSLQLMA